MTQVTVWEREGGTPLLDPSLEHLSHGLGLGVPAFRAVTIAGRERGLEWGLPFEVTGVRDITHMRTGCHYQLVVWSHNVRAGPRVRSPAQPPI